MMIALPAVAIRAVAVVPSVVLLVEYVVFILLFR